MTEPLKIDKWDDAIDRLQNARHGLVAQTSSSSGDMRLSIKTGWLFAQFVIPHHHVEEMLTNWKEALSQGDDFEGSVLYTCGTGVLSIAVPPEQDEVFSILFQGPNTDAFHWVAPLNAMESILKTIELSYREYEIHIKKKMN